MSIVKYEDLDEIEKARFDLIMKEAEEKEAKWFADWGFMPAEIMASRIAYQAFIEKEERDGRFGLYKAPIARKAFMMGWLSANNVKESCAK